MKKMLLQALLLAILLTSSFNAFAQESNSTVKGVITLESSGKPVHGATVTILQLKRSVTSNEDGSYEFSNLPLGKYDVLVHLDRVPDVVQTVDVTTSSPIITDFQMPLRVVGEQVVVTASGNQETSFNSIQSITTVSSLELAEKNSQSLGEALDHELGVAKRSFGPGSARPVIRGFDGDRVLVLQDGDRLGAIGFQSGDHAESVDLLSVERLEVVKGPATLLYGSNAIGGVVNAVTGHKNANPGFRGYLTGVGSSNYYQGGANAGLEYGTKNWLFWGSGGSQRTGNYDTPIGRIPNSYVFNVGTNIGLGYYTEHSYYTLSYTYDKKRYGIPFNQAEDDPEVVFLNPRRHSLNFTGGFRDIGKFIDGVQFSLQYTDYQHQEKNGLTDEVNTSFRNRTFTYRTVFDQKRQGRLSGTFGFSGIYRDYVSIGEEALAPPTTQKTFALYGLEKIDLEHALLQFGARLEHTSYNTTPLTDRLVRDRSFTGGSASVALRVPVWKGGAFVANYSHSYRAIALEELYNFGPHAGNSTFEIGDTNLKSEKGEGIELSLRQSSSRVRAEASFFYYRLRDFVFLAPTGDVDQESGLIVAKYAQGNTRYTGTEARLEVGLARNLWLVSGLDYVNAELRDTKTPLPRIPPLRGRIALEGFYKGFRVVPEVILAKDQNRIFPTETRTAGYSVVNLTASYTFAQQHTAQVFSVSAFNLGDRLYRNHLSFIKDFAPEIGRGVRFTYTLRFF